MNTREDIAGIKHRLGVLEHELYEIKLVVARWDADSSVAEPESSPLAASPEPDIAVAEPVSLAATIEPLLEVPPVLETPPHDGPPPRAWAPAPQPEPVIEEPTLPQPNPWREWLEPLQLWPPTGEANTEVRLGAWWATRIGALLAVIGIVFLGIYVSRGAPHWVRLVEVMGATGVVLGLGSWLERKLPKFGSVVFGAGLALTYFCAFAAYGVTPMKVIESPAVALVCELAAVTGILLAAWRRDSSLTATMAVLLGHVTALLALRTSATGFGPWVVLLLGAAAVALRQARTWEAPSLVALPLAWGYLLAAAFVRPLEAAMPLGAVWVWAFLYFVLFMLRDWSVAWRGGSLSTVDRGAQVANSTLAVLVGLLATGRIGDGPFMKFYFGSGVLLLGATLAWRKANVGALVPIFACKAFGLLALGVIAGFEGQARYLVLLSQAFVMLVSARQSHVRGLRTASIVAGVVSLGFFLGGLRSDGSTFVAGATLVEVSYLAGALVFVAPLGRWLSVSSTVVAIGSSAVGAAAVMTVTRWNTAGWAPLANVGLALVLLAAGASVRGWISAAVGAAILVVAAHFEMWTYLVGDWPLRLWANELVLLGAAGGILAALSRWSREEASQRLASGGVLTVAAGTLIVVCFKGLIPAAALAAASGVALLLTLAAARLPRWPMAVLSAPLLVFGCILYMDHHGPGYSSWLWVAMAGAWALPVWSAASHSTQQSIQDPNWRAWTSIIQTAVATGLTWLAVDQNFVGDAKLIGMTLAALGAFALTWKPRLLPALEASWALWLLALAYASDVEMAQTRWLAFGAAWLPVIALARMASLAEVKMSPPVWRPFAEGVQVVLATLIGFTAASFYGGSSLLVALVGVMGVAFAVWRWVGVASARYAVAVIMAVTWLAAGWFATTPAAQDWGGGLSIVMLIAGLAVLLPFALARGLDANGRKQLRWLLAAGGLALAVGGLCLQRGSVEPYITLLCGVAAVATFLAGLVARSKPHRISGLVGLAFCVGRAFIFDLDSALHRIAAFVALGVVLLWVGFSYHRFRHLIDDDEKKL